MKKYWRGKRGSRESKDSTNPASGVNAAEVQGKRKRKNKKDVSEIMQQEGTLFKHLSGAAIKLILVSAIFLSMTDARKEALKHVLCIHYPVQFKKNKTQVQVLVDSGSEVNAIHLSFAKQLGLSI